MLMMHTDNSNSDGVVVGMVAMMVAMASFMQNFYGTNDPGAVRTIRIHAMTASIVIREQMTSHGVYCYGHASCYLAWNLASF